MKNLRLIFLSLILSIIALFTGFKSGKTFPGRSSTVVSISLDSIKPGMISKKQLGAVKALVITSAGEGGITIIHKVVSFRMALIPMNGGNSKMIDAKGNNFKDNLLSYFATASLGDILFIGNLKIEGIENFKPLAPAQWTIREEKK
jgi:hypothetical protein